MQSRDRLILVDCHTLQYALWKIILFELIQQKLKVIWLISKCHWVEFYINIKLVHVVLRVFFYLHHDKKMLTIKGW